MSTLTKKAVFAALLVVAALASTGGVARAQSDYGYDDDYGYSDPEIRQTVARVAYVSGDVSFARGDDPDYWQPADPNIPMTLGDRAWTADGRLELQVHGGSIIRLARSTDLAALNLTEDTKQFSLSAGVASFQIRRLADDEVFEVDTPNAAITFERTGDYRIDVRPDGDTRVQVRRGRAYVASGGGQVPLGSGDAMLIEGYEPTRYDMIGMSPPDNWDRWVADRYARYANVRSYDYVSADIAGVQDLDQYGRWQQIPSYGWCWTPSTVAVGWAPYRAGRWIWQDPWGWTWVSTEPWGWAPYHYGRWVSWSSRWFWVPVAPRAQVVTYSPALVAFVGGGPGFSVSVGFTTDYIGWFPLAPREPLIPWWGRPTTTVVNVTNITYVNKTYVTVVTQNTFVSSRVVTTNYVRDQSIINRVERAPVIRGSIPIVPTQQSIRVSTRRTASPRPPATVASRAVVTRIAPPPAPPRFDRKVAVIREQKRPVTTVEAERIVAREGRPAPARAVRPAVQETGRVELAPKTQSARAPKPEPIAPARGRPLATKEKPVAPSSEA
ncbi:MAG: FecR domain-containing protein, partial [Actinobacteria bacterium]|nr:FecR domain-containing protein [Actinomycetota bacterium]